MRLDPGNVRCWRSGKGRWPIRALRHGDLGARRLVSAPALGDGELVALVAPVPPGYLVDRAGVARGLLSARGLLGDVELGARGELDARALRHGDLGARGLLSAPALGGYLVELDARALRHGDLGARRLVSAPALGDGELVALVALHGWRWDRARPRFGRARVSRRRGTSVHFWLAGRAARAGDRCRFRRRHALLGSDGRGGATTPDETVAAYFGHGGGGARNVMPLFFAPFEPTAPPLQKRRTSRHSVVLPPCRDIRGICGWIQ